MSPPLPQSTEPFRDALLDLLREEGFTTSMGTPNVAAFARLLERHHYETLRKVMSNERQPSATLILDVARALRVEPEHFAEYRLHLVRRMFDVREVGLERALDNLREHYDQN